MSENNALEITHLDEGNALLGSLANIHYTNRHGRVYCFGINPGDFCLEKISEDNWHTFPPEENCLLRPNKLFNNLTDCHYRGDRIPLNQAGLVLEMPLEVAREKFEPFFARALDETVLTPQRPLIETIQPGNPLPISTGKYYTTYDKKGPKYPYGFALSLSCIKEGKAHKTQMILILKKGTQTTHRIALDINGATIFVPQNSRGNHSSLVTSLKNDLRHTIPIPFWLAQGMRNTASHIAQKLNEGRISQSIYT